LLGLVLARNPARPDRQCGTASAEAAVRMIGRCGRAVAAHR